MKLIKEDFPEWNRIYLKDDFEINVLIHHLNFKPTDRILEVGCNDSELSNTLQSKGCDVWGVDVKFNEPKFKFIRGNFQDVYIPENYFDIVIDASAIHHFGLGNYGDRVDHNADIITAKKIYKSLKPNGLFYVSTDCVSTIFNPNVNNYFRQYNIKEFINRIVIPPNFKLLELITYKNNTYPLTKIDPIRENYEGTQMFALLMK